MEIASLEALQAHLDWAKGQGLECHSVKVEHLSQVYDELRLLRLADRPPSEKMEKVLGAFRQLRENKARLAEMHTKGGPPQAWIVMPDLVKWDQDILFKAVAELLGESTECTTLPTKSP
jgi:hypothetical protein